VIGCPAAGPKLGAIRIDDFKFQFLQQPYGWLGEKVTTDMHTIVNIRQDPFERTPSIRGECRLTPWREIPRFRSPLSTLP
jgi:hypothetical protein